MNQYLIPANSKRGNLILGWFFPRDLMIFGIGLVITLFLLLLIKMETTTDALIVLAPALTATLLVAPVPYYHNVLVVITEAIEFINSRQKYIWKGWCVLDETEK